MSRPLEAALAAIDECLDRDENESHGDGADEDPDGSGE